MLVQGMYGDEAQAITRKVIDLALAGDTTCLRIATDRLLPPLKSRPVNFSLPTIRTTADAMSALASLIEGASSGRLLAEQLEPLAATISTFIKAVEVAQLEDRLAQLENARMETEKAREHSRYDA
jgi:hypothetical protein